MTSNPGIILRQLNFLTYVRKLWLVKSSMIFVGLGVARGLSQFVFVTIMTRILLPADYGIYSNFLYTTSILSPLFFLKSDMPVARFYVANPRGIADYIGTVVILCSGVTFVSTIVLFFARGAVSSVTGLPGFWQMLIVVTCWAYGLSLIVLAIFQIELKAWKMSLSRILPNISCELLAMAALLALGGGWRVALTAYTAISAGWGIAFFVWLRRSGYLRFNFSFTYLSDFLHVSLPLIPMAIGFICVQISAQFVLTRYAGLSEVGIYATANQLSLGVWLLGLSAQQAFLPWLFRILERNDRAEDHKIVVALLGAALLLFPGTAIYIFIFERVLPFIVGPSFRGSKAVLGPLAWANCFLGIQMIMNCFLYYRKQTVVSAAIACIAAVFALVLGILWIPTGRTVMASHVTAASAALMALLTAVVAGWEYRDVFRNGLRTLVRRTVRL